MKPAINSPSSETNRDSSSDPARRVPAKHFKAHFSDGTCVMCGTKYIEHGRILHGHCVCEECVEYILSESDQNDGGDQSREKELTDEKSPDEKGERYDSL